MYIDKTFLIFLIIVIIGGVLFFKYKTQTIRFLYLLLRLITDSSKYMESFKMNKIKLRIFSKVGLIMVIMGFFMPVSCNLNGFQLAQYASSFGGLNFLCFGLYGILFFACIGVILLLLLVIKKPFSIVWDWFVVISTIISAILVFTEMNGGNMGYGKNMFQSGAYVMLIGMIFALVFLIQDPNMYKKKAAKDTNLPDTQSDSFNKHFCTKCGSKLQENGKFCSNCGARI